MAALFMIREKPQKIEAFICNITTLVKSEWAYKHYEANYIVKNHYDDNI